MTTNNSQETNSESIEIEVAPGSELIEVEVEAQTLLVPDATETVKGIAKLATVTDVETGTDDTKIVTPYKLAHMLQGKQDTLVSGTNIKTINNQSLLGSGNIDVVVQTTIYEQGIAADTWEITHNLNKYPSVTVVDSSGNQVTCAVRYVSQVKCILNMNGAFKGKAYLN